MERITEKELKSVIKNHQHWLKKDCEGWENMRAVLRHKNLTYMDLSNADLRYADLYQSDLSYTRLCFANFEHASFCNAWLAHADLNYVNFSYADLDTAKFDMANLYETNMVHTNLHIIRFKNTTNTPYIPMACPEEGEFIAWKQALTNNNIKMIIKLRIPADAKRLSGSSRKCRCNKAKVIGIYNIDGTVSKKRKCVSMFDGRFVYKLGKTVEVNNFDEDRWNECSTGIHFFMNKQEAINY